MVAPSVAWWLRQGMTRPESLAQFRARLAGVGMLVRRRGPKVGLLTDGTAAP
jgi:hypothetical protein